MHPLPESERRAIVIIVFPSPIASARFPPLTSCNVLGNSVVALPENTFKYKTSSLLSSSLYASQQG
uniref:Uncharacterized protein n=1 Tax=Arundo donax TaxID=35708 RepID=A0A0A9FCV5_ARUDO